jgi:hypothetical protein
MVCCLQRVVNASTVVRHQLPVAARQHWTVFVQRVWSLSQDQWTKQAADQTEEKIGK